MKNLSLEQMENVEGGKMFGKTYECIEGTTGAVCIEKSHFFWFTVHKEIYVVSQCLYCGMSID